MSVLTGQIWLGVALEEERDVCLCVRTEERFDNRGTVFGLYYHFVDLETGESFKCRQDLVGDEALREFECVSGRRRLT